MNDTLFNLIFHNLIFNIPESAFSFFKKILPLILAVKSDQKNFLVL